MIRRRVTGIFLIVFLVALMLPSFAFADDKPVIITKEYDLSQYEEYVNLILEGNDGEFSVDMTFPDGHQIVGVNSNEVNEGKETKWTNSFVIKGAPKGKYTFQITAPKDSYYNLRVYIPLFYDIADHWAEKPINDFVQKGIVNGYGDGSFRPDDPITGDALVKLAVMALTDENPSGARQWKKTFRWQVEDRKRSKDMGFQEFNFTSDKSSSWSAPYLSAAASIGIIKDWNDGVLKQPFPRKDVALLLANILQMTKVNEAKPSDYEDIAGETEKYKKAIDLVSSYTFFNGYPDGTFKPDKYVTRAEAVTVLSKLLDYLN